MSYKTPRALQAALTDRARQRAAQLGVSSGELVMRWYQQRLLARVVTHDPDGWLLKGGQAMLVRFEHAARHSRDIDLYRPSADDLEEAVQALVAGAQTHLEDHLRFEYRDRRTLVDGAATTRVAFDVHLGVTRMVPIHVDLVVGLIPIGTPTTRQLDSAVPIDWPADWPKIQLYPLVDHLADKIVAMYELHGCDKAASSRFRDLVDIVVIALRETVDGRQLRDAVRSEHDRRVTLGTTVRLPDSFVVPNQATWPAGYAKEPASVRGLEQYRTLDTATPLVDTFVSPVLSPDTRELGMWLFRQRCWTTRR